MQMYAAKAYIARKQANMNELARTETRIVEHWDLLGEDTWRLCTQRFADISLIELGYVAHNGIVAKIDSGIRFATGVKLWGAATSGNQTIKS